MGTIRINDKDYSVSDSFMETTGKPYPDLLDKTYPSLKMERNQLLELSTARWEYEAPTPEGSMAPGGTLTIEEHNRLQAIVRAMIVHKAANILTHTGKSHTDYGLNYLDQVHGTLHSRPCGCIVHSIFDHHLIGDESLERYPIKPRHSCEAHAHLVDNHAAHFAAAHEVEPDDRN